MGLVEKERSPVITSIEGVSRCCQILKECGVCLVRPHTVGCVVSITQESMGVYAL